MQSRRDVLRVLGAAPVGAGMISRQTAARSASSISNLDNSIVQRSNFSYDGESKKVTVELSYQLPPSVTELTIGSVPEEFERVSVDTKNLQQEDKYTHVWSGGSPPKITIDISYKSDNLSDGFFGYASKKSALVSTIGTDPSWRYSTESPDFVRESEVNGEGYAGTETVYLGPHDRELRNIEGKQLALIVPEEVTKPIDGTDILDVLQLGLNNLKPRFERRKYTAFVFSSVRQGNYTRGRAIATDILLSEEVAQAGKYTPPHEFAHTIYGVFDGEEMYWLKEGIAQYIGHLLNLNAGLITFEQFISNIRTERYKNVNLSNYSSSESGAADYRKGAHVLAALDAEIRIRSGSQNTLIDVMGVEDADLSTYEGFESAVTRFSGDSEITNWLDKYIRSSGLPEIPSEPQYYTLDSSSEDDFRTPTPTSTPTQSPTENRMQTETPQQTPSEPATVENLGTPSSNTPSDIEATIQELIRDGSEVLNRVIKLIGQ